MLCVDILAKMEATEATGKPSDKVQPKRRHPLNQPLGCGFCGKPETEVKKLIAGPTIYICDVCVALCVDIIEEEKAKVKT